jgi:peptidylprolyl isomerase
MAQAKYGDTVKVHYTGKLDDGTIFDSSIHRDPLQFTIGDGHIIPGFEQAVVGMHPGESRTTVIPADEAYGPYHEEMVLIIDRNLLPADMKPTIGMQLQMSQANGQRVVVMITDVSESSVTLDANHPLAGEDLTFDIQLIEIG